METAKDLAVIESSSHIKVILIVEAFQKLLNEKKKVLILDLSSKANKSIEERVDLIYSVSYVFLEGIVCTFF